MKSLCKGVVAIALVAMPMNFARSQSWAHDTRIAQAQTAAVEQRLPGEWSATSPLGTTKIFLKFDANPAKNADGSLLFSGRWWSTGAVQNGGEPLQLAKMTDGKLLLQYPAGNGALELTENQLAGYMVLGTFVLKDMKFAKAQ